MIGQAQDPVTDLVQRARDPQGSIHAQHFAFAALVERFEPAAFAAALEACHDPESARDACQEAFLLAWRKLPALREPAAFGGWLQRLVRTQCARTRRRDASAAHRVRAWMRERGPQAPLDTAEIAARRETRALVRGIVAGLPAAQREAVVLVYFLGEPLRVVARTLGVTEARAGRLVYEARLRLRRNLPRGVRASLFRHAATTSFTRDVQAGLFDELVGTWRFEGRPDHRVVVWREGDALVCESGGQRNVLMSSRPDRLAPTEYDGEARVRRNRRGEVSHFVYYEFGRRLGIARRIRTRGRGASRSRVADP